MKDRKYTLTFLLRDDQILLAMKKRGFGADKWNGVGGKLEEGETMEQAMVRECQEEIGVTPKAYSKVAFHDFILGADTAEPWHQWVDAYLVTEWEGEPVETEEMAPQWFKIDAIPYEKMWDDDIHWLPLVLEGKLLETSFTFDSDDHMMDKVAQEVTEFNDK